MTVISNPNPRSPQSGMATLMFAVVLLIALTIITFLSAKTLLAEQAISANEYRAKEAAYAAEAALEYGIAWLADNEPDFDSWNADDLDADGTAWNDLAAPDLSLSSGTDSYTLSVFYTRACLEEGMISEQSCLLWQVQIEARAVADSDSDLSRTQWLRLMHADMDDDDNPEYIRIPGSWRDWEAP